VVERLDDVWASRDFPVLVEVTRRFDAGASSLRVEDVAEALDMNADDVRRAGVALSRRGLVTTAGSWQVPVLRFTEIDGRAYLMTGLHPDGDDAVSRLIAAVQQAAELVDDPEERGRLRRLADSAMSVGRGVLTDVLAAVITRTTFGS